MSHQPQQQPKASSAQRGDGGEENQSLWNLRMELGDDAELLKYLPYHRTTFQPQTELAGAASERLLYGDMMEEKDQLWIYFTLFGGGASHNLNGKTRMISFYTLKGAQNGEAPILPGKVRDMALASQPFKAAADYWEVVSVAKYYFIKRGVGQERLKCPISVTAFKDDLLRACKDYQAAYEAQKDKNKPRAITANTSPQGSPATPSHRAPSSAPTGPRADIRASVVNAQYSATPAPPSHGRKRSRSPGSYHDSSRPPSPFLSSARPSYSTHPPASASSTSAHHNTMVDEYIALQTTEEDFDSKITAVERTRLNVMEKLASLQSELETADKQRDDLMRDKASVRAAKKRLQATLKLDDHFDVGFEAGVKMERKRLRRE